MSKKNKKHVLKAAKAMTLDRLATTVRADDPTVILGAASFAKGKATPSLSRRFTTGVSRIAQRFVPVRMRVSPQAAAGIVQDRKANKRLRKLAQQIAKGRPVGPKPRRSRLPLVIAALLMLISGGGYWAYQAINLPKFDSVAKVLDYNRWLDAVSGRVKPGAAPKQTAVARKPAARTQKVVVKSSARKSSKQTTGKRSAAKKKVSPVQKKAWKKKLAKLEKKSQKKYQRASRVYRTSARKPSR